VTEEKKPKVRDTVEAAEKDYKKINRTFWTITIITMAIYGATVAGMFMSGMDPKKIVAYGTTFFQFGVIAWGLSFMAPYFLRMERKSDVSISLGRETAEMIEEMKDEMRNVIDDIKNIIDEVKGKDGDLGELRDAIKDIPKKLDELKDRIDDGKPFKKGKSSATKSEALENLEAGEL